MKIDRKPINIALLKHSIYGLDGRIRRKSIDVYDDVCVLCYERWRHFVEWEPTLEVPSWIENMDPTIRLDNIYRVGLSLEALADQKREDDYLYVSIFQSDPDTICKGLKFLHSKMYLRAWNLFYEKIARFGSYDKVFLTVTQLYEDYIKFCVEVLQKKPIFKTIQTEYPDFTSLLNAAIWCVKYNIDPTVYIKTMYDSFDKFEKKVNGPHAELCFSSKHVGSTSQVRPPVRQFIELSKEGNPWKEIINFMGLREDVRIECSSGIPLGFSLADRHKISGLMKEITLIQDEYYWANGIRYQARFNFDDNTIFTIFITPENFNEFKDRWNTENPAIPSYEELVKYGRGNLTKDRYKSIKKLYERMM